MSFCPQCGHDVSDAAKFCESCGATVASTMLPLGVSGSSSAKKKKPPMRRILFGLVASSFIWVGIGSLFFFGPNSCSSTTGSLTTRGETLGDLKLTPGVCRSGEHEAFHGVYLHPGEEPKGDEGSIKILKDPRSGYEVQLLRSGECDGEACEPYTIDKKDCQTYKVQVERTNASVNEITLMDGSLELDCELGRSKRGKEEGEVGSVRANITFESCD